jgi:fermentation-respiration switch protein FrsA (DUF1100 family)
VKIARPRIKQFCGLALLLFIVFLMIRWFEHSQVYHPSRELVATAASLNRPFEDVHFKTKDGLNLNGWFFPGDTNSPRAGMAVLLCHGNGGNISHRLDMCEALLQTGVSVFIFDYRGYGFSEGRPSEEGTYQDAQAAFRWLSAKGFLGSAIIAYGESLGGGVASEIAIRENVGGLILQSAFSCMPDIGAEVFPWLPVRLISTIKYNTCDRLPRIKVPVLIMHSHTDGLIGFHHAEKNFKLANEPKLLWEITGSHNEPVSDSKKYLEGVEKMFEMMEGAPTRRVGRE